MIGFAEVVVAAGTVESAAFHLIRLQAFEDKWLGGAVGPGQPVA
jgi:hypothetical protein